MEVMTEEERRKRLDLSRRMHDALERGDDAEYSRLMTQIEAPAEALLAAKMHSGADWIREMGLNTKRADEKYGTDWLDR